MNTVIVGLGLIGGSLARALSGAGHRVLAVETDEDALLDAQSLGCVEHAAGPEDLKIAQLVILAVPPRAAVAFLRQQGPLLGEQCLVTDCCGVKGSICRQAQALQTLPGHRYAFVGGHPMAGKEKWGFSSGDASLFRGASWLLVRGEAPDWAVDRAVELVRAVGAKPVFTTPEEHDRVVAYTSQLPHVLACAYVMSPRCGEHKGFSAGSYRDVSRVADINSPLWAQLFLENRESLCGELDELMKNLSRLRERIAAGDREGLTALLEQAGAIKRREG